uniref:Uncharacterized protein n=1 Tax=Zea mays TaxID=4577 RepID=B6SUX4_MAIZE|nr:hypothetical protein [Zea mays]
MAAVVLTYGSSIRKRESMRTSPSYPRGPPAAVRPQPLSLTSPTVVWGYGFERGRPSPAVSVRKASYHPISAPPL